MKLMMGTGAWVKHGDEGWTVSWTGGHKRFGHDDAEDVVRLVVDAMQEMEMTTHRRMYERGKVVGGIEGFARGYAAQHRSGELDELCEDV